VPHTGRAMEVTGIHGTFKSARVEVFARTFMWHSTLCDTMRAATVASAAPSGSMTVVLTRGVPRLRLAHPLPVEVVFP
jgi:hypothetical protein